jgi:hypothetical protein
MIYNFVILSFRWSHEALILVISHTYSHSYEPVTIEELASRFDADWPQFQKLHLKDDIIVSTDQICGGVVVRTCELQVTDYADGFEAPGASEEGRKSSSIVVVCITSSLSLLWSVTKVCVEECMSCCCQSTTTQGGVATFLFLRW